MKAKRQIESSLNSVTMLDGSGGQIIRNSDDARIDLRLEVAEIRVGNF